ncbi:MAG TPA: primosomal protein N' [Pyrinomonadaceae bacterium]|nr:primosomal protein N' [Pyrinomonadaceae bacterium]
MFPNQNPPQFAELALPLPLKQTFTYRLPENIRENVQIGSRLLVPFGKRNLTGYTVELHETLDESLGIEESQIKEAIELLDEEPLITEEILRLTNWTADYYSASWGEVLKASLPAGVNVETEQIVQITTTGRDELFKVSTAKTAKVQILNYLSEQEEVSMRQLTKQFGASTANRILRDLVKQNWVTSFQKTLATKTKPKRRKAVRLLPNFNKLVFNEKQEQIIQILIENDGEFGFTELLEEADISSSVIQTLEKKGVVQTFVREVRRNPLENAKLPDALDLTLSDGQADAFETIANAISSNNYQGFLLHGVTGSGKTEIYIRAMNKALELGKTGLMLVPEIALTPVFSRRLGQVFGEQVAILHSSLSTGERFDEWRRIRNGSARIVIGTRSAIFAPLQNVGIIIVDEEHDGSYRQQESPFYHARDVAVVRANFAKAVVVLGSATPSLETFHNAKNNKYIYLHLPNRIGNRPLAKAELVDMRNVFKEHGKDEIFSDELLTAIEETHAKGEQSIILLNRRGFSQFVLCRTCGETIRCQNCDITLTFHRRDNVLMCHYCGFRAKVPHKCPFCDSKFIYFIGEGTEQIEDMLRRKFSTLRIARVDRDSTRRRKSFEETLLDFSEHKIDMLVGTQMLAKGHDFPNVTLVGVVSVDAGLGLPDFRSAERTFQLLTQVAGRAGRGLLQGRVIIQTFYPDHYALQHACTQSYEDFYAEEIRFRQKLGYPPFVALASILVHHANYNYAFDNAMILKECLNNANTERQARILGPAPAPLARLKGEHRLQMLIKSVNRKKLRELLDFALHEAQEKFCDMKTVNVEIDPVNLL